MSPRRTPSILGLVVVLVSLSAGVWATPQSERPQVRWGDRLEALRPDDAVAYLELAEEVADQARGSADRALAERLFALAGVLDPQRFGRSACLALGDMAIDERTARRYRAVAALLDRRGGTAGGRGAEVELNPQTALEVCEALSLYRRGLGGPASTRLARSGGRAVLERNDWALDGGATRFFEDIRRYRGQSRPRLSARDTAAMLQLEIGLLEPEARPWSVDLRMTGGQPLTEADPARLAELFGVDPRRCVFRDGRWTAP